jgi:hypothetical protein
MSINEVIGERAVDLNTVKFEHDSQAGVLRATKNLHSQRNDGE